MLASRSRKPRQKDKSQSLRLPMVLSQDTMEDTIQEILERGFQLHSGVLREGIKDSKSFTQEELARLCHRKPDDDGFVEFLLHLIFRLDISTARRELETFSSHSQTDEAKILAQMFLNRLFKSSREDTRDLLLQFAGILVSGYSVPDDQVSTLLTRLVPYDQRTVELYLPEKFKDQEMRRRAISSPKQSRNISASPPSLSFGGKLVSLDGDYSALLYDTRMDFGSLFDLNMAILHSAQKAGIDLNRVFVGDDN